jgi:glycosyltransferase involved in cell wall biosynthesis
MKTFYVINRYDGCYYVRCLLPQRHNGWNGSLNTLYDSIDRLREAKECINSDVVVFHRPDSDERIEAMKILKQMGKLVVFDNDDTYKVDDKMERIGVNFNQTAKKLDEAMEVADLITCSTEFLAKEYREKHKNVVVLPNCVDEFYWSEPLKNNSDKIRVGIVGSTTFNDDFLPAQELLKYLSKDDRFQLVMFGVPPRVKMNNEQRKHFKKDLHFWEQMNVEWCPFVPMFDYFDTLNELRLDVMIIPRRDNYFNRCKSNIKWLEASMLEIPVIAQDFEDSPYRSIQHGKTGYLTSDWNVKDLLLNRKELRKIGNNAKKYVLNNYNISKKANLWIDAYQSAMNKKV